MSNDRELLKQALEALETYERDGKYLDVCRPSITALRAALAEPVSDALPPLPEPAFLSCDYSLAWSVEKLAGWSKRDSAQYTVPLFTADQMRSYAAECVAAEREPLTDERIDAAVEAWFKEEIQAGRQPFGRRMRAAINAALGISAPASAPKEQA